MRVACFLVASLVAAVYGIPGGWSEWKPVTPEHQEDFQTYILPELPEKYQNSKATEYRTQVVAGTNYEVKIYTCGKEPLTEGSCTGGIYSIVSFYRDLSGSKPVISEDDIHELPRSGPSKKNLDEAEIANEKRSGEWTPWKPVTNEIQAKFIKVLGSHKSFGQVPEEYQGILRVSVAKEYRTQTVNGKNYQIKLYSCGKEPRWNDPDIQCTGGTYYVVTVYGNPGDKPIVTGFEELPSNANTGESETRSEKRATDEWQPVTVDMQKMFFFPILEQLTDRGQQEFVIFSEAREYRVIHGINGEILYQVKLYRCGTVPLPWLAPDVPCTGGRYGGKWYNAIVTVSYKPGQEPKLVGLVVPRA